MNWPHGNLNFELPGIFELSASEQTTESISRYEFLLLKNIAINPMDILYKDDVIY